MKTRQLFTFLASIAAVALGITQVAGSPTNAGMADSFAPDTILVKFQRGSTAIEQNNANHRNGGAVVGRIPQIGVQIVRVARGRVDEKIRAYRGEAAVEYAEPDFLAQVDATPNDPSFVQQWGLGKVQGQTAWDITMGSSLVRIAILDTGISASHPDLSSKVVAAVNFGSSTTADDLYGHGTHVAGIAAAATNNGLGVAGISWSSSLMNVKVMGDDGTGSYSAIANGIIWATDNGANVINMSLSGSSASPTLESALSYAWNKGVVVVAAAGNNASATPRYPAYYANAMAVAATNSSDARAIFSNYGDWVDIAAPGVSIYSTVPSGTCPMCDPSGYRNANGTSMATPYVAGLAALVFATAGDANGNGLLSDEVRACIETNADNIGVSGMGSGRINANMAVQCGVSASKGRISGVVTDASTGLPIASALVTVGTAQAQADVSGAYSITSLQPATYTVIAQAPDYLTTSATVDVAAGQAIQANMSLPAAPKSLTVHGITASNKVYDGTTTATLNTGSATLVGVAGGDAVSLNAAGATGAFDTKYTGMGKTVQVGGLSIGGADAGKYTLAQPTATANIMPGVRGNVDTPQDSAVVSSLFEVAGWVIDSGAASGTGIDEVRVYRDGTIETGTLLGTATYDLARADIATAFGAQFVNAGYYLSVTGVAAGNHTLSVYAHDTGTGGWTLIGTRTVTRLDAFVSGDESNPRGGVELPTDLATVSGSFWYAGWMIDLGASASTGIDQIEVYDGGTTTRGTGSLLGTATYGSNRTDIGSIYGAQFTNSGYGLIVTGLTTGSHTLSAFGHSTVSDTWVLVGNRTVTQSSRVTSNIEVARSSVNDPLKMEMAGWAVDLGAAEGTGIDQVRVYEGTMSSGTLLATATYGYRRSDVAAAYNNVQFTNSGFYVVVSGVTAGSHVFYVYAHDSGAGSWTIVGTRTLTVG